MELRLEGTELDQYGFLADIAEIESHLDAAISYYKDRSLNDLPEFTGANPSIERFASVICREISKRISLPNIDAVAVRIWENDIAWASFRLARLDD